ncbi:hypothetical protein [Kitasatospora sp. A2-31]|uniref:hypothetical protein n=1 Tax=Kitasatospora sp. A2-31 TaxID=2916414 RepID=UPI001EEF69A9|nr:hypothetical protein [Kitasatospora sp. A2-31]MCG6499466.1 hypothetical protein [Kitasatospora sp. A2-31]
MPRSVFLGRPVPGPGEVLWTDEDRAWALALLQVEAETCSCGHPLADTLDGDLEESWRAEIVRCHACATAARHLDGWRDAGGDTRGAQVRVTRREGRRG